MVLPYFGSLSRQPATLLRELIAPPAQEVRAELLFAMRRERQFPRPPRRKFRAARSNALMFS